MAQASTSFSFRELVLIYHASSKKSTLPTNCLRFLLTSDINYEDRRLDACGDRKNDTAKFIPAASNRAISCAFPDMAGMVGMGMPAELHH
jgi:hypothetical protein